MTTVARADVRDPELTVSRRLGGAYLAAAGSWVLYIVLIVVNAGYEEALADAAEAAGTAVNRLPAETLAEIGRDHPWSNLTTVGLFLVPALLVVATRRTAAVTGDRRGLVTAWLAAAVLWLYLALNLGLLAGPDSLPPLTRDLDVLTVPLVSLGSLLSTAAFVLAALSLRRHRLRPVASTVAAVVATLLLVSGVVTLVASGFDEPVAPVGLLPAELVLGIALLVGGRGRLAAGAEEV